MKQDEFDQIIQEQLERCERLLLSKGKEYAEDKIDRLHTFKRAASLQGINPERALLGMLTKHVISIYDMCSEPARYDKDLWDEKITDAINYLLLLRAVVDERLACLGRN